MYDPPAADFDHFGPLHCSGEGETTPKEQRRQAETALNSVARRPVRCCRKRRWTRISCPLDEDKYVAGKRLQARKGHAPPW